MIRYSLAALAAVALAAPAVAAPKAFPTAAGYGAGATGGRGGAVHHVTTLSDSGTGSLRACVDATGPRTCVFRVGGTITLSTILQPGQGRLTIAGQTAPGGGIQLKLSPNHSKPLFRVQVADVVVRHIRFRRGPTSLSASRSGTCCGDTISLMSGADRVIFDRVSIGFATDENVNPSAARNLTIQRSIIAYGLRYSTSKDTVSDPQQHHSMGVLISENATNISLLDNLLAFNANRNPRIQSGSNEVCGNVVYGASFNPITISGGTANVIGNRFDARPLNDYSFVIQTSGSGRAHAAANVSSTPVFRSGAASSQSAFATPSCAGRSPVALASVGPLPRDALDGLTVTHAANGTGRLIDDPSEVGGWPSLANGTPYPDADRDGMDDGWERSRGLDPANANDRNLDRDGDGYTELEEFLNELAGDVG